MEVENTTRRKNVCVCFRIISAVILIAEIAVSVYKLWMRSTGNSSGRIQPVHTGSREAKRKFACESLLYPTL